MPLILQMRKLSFAEMEKNSHTHSEWRMTAEIQVNSPVPPKPWAAWKMEVPGALHPVFSNCLKESWNEWTEVSSPAEVKATKPAGLGCSASPGAGPIQACLHHLQRDPSDPPWSPWRPDVPSWGLISAASSGSCGLIHQM